MGKVWSVGVFAEDPDYNPVRPLENLIKTFNAKKLRLAKKHIHTYADPFLFVHNDILYVLAEVQETNGNGYINAWKTDDLSNWTDLGCILKEPHHLSYPLVFSTLQDGKIYMVPESSQEKSIALYEFEAFPFKPRKTRYLLYGNYADTNIILQDGVYFLSTTNQDKGEHELYYSESLFANWEKHPLSPILNYSAFSRNGGGFFRINGKLYRAAQNATNKYGEGSVIFEVLELTKTNYNEVVVEPDFRPRVNYDWQQMGRHHFSIVDFRDKMIVAIDGLQNDFLANKLLNLIFKII